MPAAIATANSIRRRVAPAKGLIVALIGPESARPPQRLRGIRVITTAHDLRRIATEVAVLTRKDEPRCAVLRFASALRLRLRVQARADPGGNDRHEGRVCRAAKPSEDLAHDDQPLPT